MNAKILRLSVVIITLITLISCSSDLVEFGVIEGQVTIGPLVPVLREDEIPPTPSPEVYSAREIVVYESNGNTEYARLQIDEMGNYQGELPVGTYVIDINRLGIDHAEGLPKEIEIASGVIIRIDIDIDTGIR